MSRIALHILLFALACGLRAQDRPDFLELRSDESELRSLFELLYDGNPANPDSLLNEIDKAMEVSLRKPGAMDYPWNRLDRIGKIASEDGILKIYTWHYEDGPDAFRYFGFIQVRKKRAPQEVYPMVDRQMSQRGVYRADQSIYQWYGKLYYGMVSKKHRRKTCYTLLGMDFNNSRSNIKSVEVMSILRNKPRFERELFFNGNQKADRVVLEYSDQVAITVRFDPKLEMIVFDHLVPLHPVYENNLEFYGPDGSYDGLEFSEGLWHFREDIDARMPD